LKIGSIQLENNVISAPMAGVSDRPYRQLARAQGAGMAVSEMLTSRTDLRHTSKTKFRMKIEAAKFNAGNGADMIDINMGCPAKKVCKKLAGSALLSDESLVADILEAVVSAVDVPVTLKIRTGVTPEERNAINIAKIAEDSGIQALTIHGRTRQCKFVGMVEYDTIAAVKQSVNIPIIANGDIDSPEKAQEVLDHTKADAIMIGRAAQGRPWLFGEVVEYLETGLKRSPLTLEQKFEIIMPHIQEIHEFYGERIGLKLARKHIGWYLNKLSPDLAAVRADINRTTTIKEQTVNLEAALRQFIIEHKRLEAA